MQTPSEQKVLRFAQLSFAVSIVVLTLKLWAYVRTGSTAVLSDALESIVNVVASLVALWVTKAVQEPADEDHPYGHGKLEYFSSAFEGGLVAFAAIAIAYGAIRSMLGNPELQDLEQGLWLMCIAGLINFALGFALVKVGRANHSVALQASGTHVLSDVWSTVAVLVGLIIVKWTGWNWLDPVVALIVALLLLRQGYGIVRESIGGLIDEMEPESLTEVARAFDACREEGIIDIHQVKLIRSGKFHHIDAHLVVPEFWDVTKANKLAMEFEKAIIKKYPYEGEIAFHIDPCFREFCLSCDVQDCPVRVQAFHKRRDFTGTGVIKGPVADMVSFPQKNF